MTRIVAAIALVIAAAAPGRAQTPPPVTYVVTFPEPEHHWLQVEARFPDVGRAPLDVRMSRSSPGRYAVHEFAKNVFSFDAFDAAGRALTPTRPDADVWRIAGHDGTVRVVYRLFGDTADGTHMAVDTTHAHLNMPATFMWAVGLDDRPVAITFVPPPASGWSAGTQLYPTADPFRFTAPNLQYFMDSPTELARLVTSTFDVPNPGHAPAHFRVMTHSDGAQADVDALTALIARLVREEMAVFGELPDYEPGTYTFLLDLVGWTHSDAMEHRNSTYISSPAIDVRTANGRLDVLDMIAHEFFHTWNIERIRPAGLEPFDFTRENVTCCLWLGEGFTQYYGELLLRRAGLSSALPLSYGPLVQRSSSARQTRSAVEMSEYAPFADAAVANDASDAERTFLSYYDFGAGLALDLDLTLRERSGGRQSLDDYMRRLWQEFGRTAAPRPGYVAMPYTLADLRRVLAELTGDSAFANAFFDRYVEGHEAIDIAPLFTAIGLVPTGDTTPSGWIGAPQVSADAGGLRLGSVHPTRGEWLAPFGSPLYAAGLDAGDRLVTIDGEPATLARWNTHVARARPGDRLVVGAERRDGRAFTTTIVVAEDPGDVFWIDSASPTDAQRRLRAQWLDSRVQAALAPASGTR
jgi:predicted metalloprotease with PDZ domain